MFENIGWLEILVLVVAGLFILGPERLPSAAAWLGRTVRQVREYATGARDQLRSELGPEFEDLRKPLEELRGIRKFDARTAVTQHLFDGDDPMADRSSGGRSSSSRFAVDQGQLAPDERPPFDPDAT